MKVRDGKAIIRMMTKPYNRFYYCNFLVKGIKTTVTEDVSSTEHKVTFISHIENAG